MTENRAIIDYNTIKENLEMERIQHDIEIKALEEKLRVAIEALEKIENLNDDTTAMGIARQALEVITKES